MHMVLLKSSKELTNKNERMVLMIKEFVLKWEERKSKLEEKIRNTPQSEYNTYEKLVKMLFDIVINYGEPMYNQYDTSYIIRANEDAYRGTYIFVLHKEYIDDSYIEDYIYTTVRYGTCSGCDILKNINGDGYSYELPNEEQVKDYMTLILHLLQKCHRFES